MDEFVRKLARARDQEVDLGLKIAELEADLANTEPGQWLAYMKELLKAARAETADAETGVRNAALAIHEATGDKQPHPAVKVVLSTRLYYDPTEALDYAREHLPQALALAKSAFEKAAKAIGLDFVTISQEPDTRINKDLSEYLESPTARRRR